LGGKKKPVLGLSDGPDGVLWWFFDAAFVLKITPRLMGKLISGEKKFAPGFHCPKPARAKFRRD